MRRSDFSERLAQIILIILVIALPWWFGGVHAEVQAICFLVMSVPLIIWCIDLFRGGKNQVALPLVILIPLAGMALGILQIVPLSTDLVRKISPNTIKTQEALSSGTAGIGDTSVQDSDGKTMISLYPEATRQTLLLFSLGLIAFCLGARFFNESSAVILLCVFLAINGTLYSIFSIVQYLQWNGLIYWTYPVSPGSGAFGSFINRNNAGGYLNLCLAGAFGMIIWRLSRTGYSGSSGRNEKVVMYSETGSSGLRSHFSGINLISIISLALSVFIVAGVVCSRSRGAILSLGAGMVIVFIVLLRTRQRSFPILFMGLPVLAGLFLVVWVGMTQDVNERIAMLFDKETLMNTRIPNWLDAVKIVPDYPVTGTGLGTYHQVYKMYQDETDENWYYHAENEYLESVVEAGLPGLGLIILMLLFLVPVSLWLTGLSYEPRFYAASIAFVFVLASQLTHFIFDFGLHIPSNLILFSLLMGSLAGSASMEASLGELKKGIAFPRSRFFNVGLAGVLLATGIFGFLERREFSIAEKALNSAVVPAPEYEQELNKWDQVISSLDKATVDNPENADLYQALGYAYVGKYRKETYDIFLQQVPKTHELTDLDRRNIWKNTSTLVLNTRFHQLKNSGNAEELDELKTDDRIVRNLYPAIEAFQKAVINSPIMGSSHEYLARLSPLKPEVIDEEKELENAILCSPSDHNLQFHAGVIHYAAGRDEKAVENWKKSLTLNDHHVEDIRKISGARFSPADFVEKILPGRTELALELVTNRFTRPGDLGTRNLLIARIEKLLEEEEHPEDKKSYYRAVIKNIQKDYEATRENYSRALLLNPENAQWHYEFAIFLRDRGDLRKALDHARKSTLLVKNKKEYKELLDQISELYKNTREIQEEEK